MTWQTTKVYPHRDTLDNHTHLSQNRALIATVVTLVPHCSIHMNDATKISLCVVVILQQQMSKDLELTSALLALEATPAFADQEYSS